MEIKVTGCKDCPFVEFNEIDLSAHCTLIFKLSRLSEFEDLSEINYNTEVISKNKKTLDNCPLLEGDITVKLEI